MGEVNSVAYKQFSRAETPINTPLVSSMLMNIIKIVQNILFTILFLVILSLNGFLFFKHYFMLISK